MTPIHGKCRCGKRSWRTREDAEAVVVEAKIRAGLRGNTKRREQRVYQCERDPRSWHTTSTPHYTGTGLPTYSTDDDEAAKAFIGEQIYRPNPDFWTALLAHDRVEQTCRVLGRIHQQVLAKGADRRANLAAEKVRMLRRDITRDAYAAQQAAHEDWLRRSAHFGAVVVSRLQEARQAVKAANVARSADSNSRENVAHRDSLRRLTLAVAHHRTHTDTPASADRQLWAWLDILTVPYDHGATPLARMVADGSWADTRADTRTDMRAAPP